MQLGKEKISPFQMMVLTACLVLGFAALALPGKPAGHQLWQAYIAALLINFLFIYVYSSLAARFPGQTPVQFNSLIFGLWGGKILSVFLLGFLFLSVSMLLRIFGDFLLTTELPETPLYVVLGLMIFLCASTVRNGIEVMGRCASVLLVFPAFTTPATIILLIPDMNFQNFLPLFDISPVQFGKTVFEITAMPFGITAAMLMIYPFLPDTKKARFPVMLGTTLAFVFFFAAAVRDTAVLGPLIKINLFPSLEAVRQINLADIFTRLEILFAINIIFMVYIAISLLYLGIVLGLAQLFGLKDHLPLVFPIGIILVVLAVLEFENVVESLEFAMSTFPYFALFFELVIPLLSLVVAVVRRKKGSLKT